MELKEHMRRVDSAIERMTLEAETQFLRKVRRLSRKFPNRIIMVMGGMGALYVNISPKVTGHAITQFPWGSAGRHEYTLSHGGDIDGPEFLSEARDWLFAEMEEIESESVLWHFGPMIAPGLKFYRNGAPITNPEWPGPTISPRQCFT